MAYPVRTTPFTVFETGKGQGIFLYVASESTEGARAMQAIKFSVFGQEYKLLKKKKNEDPM